MKPATYDIEVYKGEDFRLSFVVKNPDGTLVDLSGSQVVSAFRHEQEKETQMPFVANIDIVTATVSISMDKVTTNTLRLGAGIYDIVLTDASGFSEVILKGAMQVRYSPTVSLAD